MNELIVKKGGVSIHEIIKSNDNDADEHQNECNDDDDKCDSNYDTQKNKWWKKIQSIPSEYKNSVIPAQYVAIAGRLNEIGTDRPDDALRMHLFVRTYFPLYKGSGDEIESIKEILYMKKKLKDHSRFPIDTKPPVIKPIAPHENKIIGDNKPKIEITLYDGDISQRQLNLSKLVFTLDGQDLTDKMTVTSKINTSGKLGPIFEKLRLVYEPTASLPHGKHTVYIKASDLKEQASEKTWSFTIK